MVGYLKKLIYGKKVVVDSRIITGQNPASAYGVAEELKSFIRKLKIPVVYFHIL